MAATARAQRQAMGLQGDGPTDEEQIFQQFMDDMSDSEHDDDEDSDRYFPAWYFMLSASRLPLPASCLLLPASCLMRGA